MVETNARILAPGPNIALPVRMVRLEGTTNTPELREKVCYRLRQECGLIAAPCQEKRGMLVVATDKPVPQRRLHIDEWEVTLTDEDEEKLLTLDTSEGRQLLPELVERMVTNAIERRGKWWTFDSLRYWYEKDAFEIKDGIEAYRRYAVSVCPIEGVGIAVAIDVETAFFTQETVAHFFDSCVDRTEQRRRQSRFEHLTQRQAGQKGTLLYDNGVKQVKCYFERLGDKTCGATKPRRVRRKDYRSLVEYYEQTNPRLNVRSDAPVAFVSFNGLDDAQPVGADLLRIRVMNDALPETLINVDKIPPDERKNAVAQFWETLGDLTFPQIRTVSSPNSAGLQAGKFLQGFWRPEASRIRRIPFPNLYFQGDHLLKPPAKSSAADYKNHYKQRAELLGKVGAYHFPPAIERSLVCAYPESADLCHAAEEMMNGLCERLKMLTGKPFEFRLLPYETLEDAITELAQEKSPGTAIFVLNHEADAYAKVAFGLSDWKIKRVTQNTLREKYRRLTMSGMPNQNQGQTSWRSFLRMTTLDLFQVMDGIPFRIEQAGNFEAQLIIDVSYDRRSYALSFLVARKQKTRHPFRLISDAWQKPDVKHEAINGIYLYDDIRDLALRSITPEKDAPLTSLLIARDGRIVGDERSAILRAVEELKKRGILTSDAHVEIVELHKATEMHLRLWDVDEKDMVANVLEGTAVRLTSTTEILAATGAGTLTQGTAEPLLVVADEDCACIGEITDSLSAATHLNWSSPSVAQRLPLPFKRTDEVLKARAEQEIRRYR